jgi:arginine repressor
MRKEPKVPPEMVKTAMLELFEEQEEFENQKEIILALNAKGLFPTQAMVSRELKKIGAKQNGNYGWALSDEEGYEQRLKKLKELFNEAGSPPRLYADVGMMVVRTEPYYGAKLADQIAETFKEVLFTLCPDNKSILICYHLRKKEAGDAKETTDTDNESAGAINLEQSSTEDTHKTKANNLEGLYEKSPMRSELFKIRKEMREKEKKRKARE